MSRVRPKVPCWVSAALGVGVTLACSASPTDDDCASMHSAIVNGASSDPLGLSSAQREAVVELRDSSREDGLRCSGTLIAPHWVVSAKHCAQIPSPRVYFGSGGSTPIVRSVEHPTEDVLLLQLAKAATDAVPIPVLGSDANFGAGAEVVIAGYGLTESTPGLRFASERLVAVQPSLLVVSGAGKTGACLGDSGGPLLTTSALGPALLGSLSAGAASCLGRDNYVRLAPLASWMARAGVPSSAWQSASNETKIANNNQASPCGGDW